MGKDWRHDEPEDRDPTVTGEDGVRVLEITDAVLASGRTAQPVDLG